MSVSEAIEHYQRSIERNTGNDERILYCIEKLYRLPVTVTHLQETGVGRTVNSLRKFDGEVGEAARALVAKWKAMVAEDSSDSEAEFQVTSTNGNGSNKDREKEKCVSHEANNGDNETPDTTSVQEEKKSNSKSSEDKYSLKKKKKEDKEKRLKRKPEDDEDPRSSKMHKSQESSSTQKVASVRHENASDNNSESSETETKNKKERRAKEKQIVKTTSKSHSTKSSDLASPKSKHIHEKNKSDKKTHNHDKTIKSLSKSSSSLGDRKTNSKKAKSDSSRISSSDHSLSSKDSPSSSREISLTKAGHSHSEKVNGTTKIEKVKRPRDSDEDCIDSYSGASFAEALGMIGTGKSPKKKTAAAGLSNSSPMQTNSKTSSSKSVNSSNIYSSNSSQGRTTPVLLTQTVKLPPLDMVLPSTSLPPTISLNYRPLPYNSINEDFMKTSLSHQQAAVGLGITSKNQRTKVYSGNKGSLTHVPSLYEMCIRLLQENIDAVEYTGGVPYDILRPVLERASPEQLFVLEHHNPYLIEDSDPLWKFHCEKKFRGHPRQEMEGWRETYLRCQDEQEAKLKSLTANIRQSQQVKTAPVRKAKMAFLDTAVKPPRNIAKKQAQYGTARTPVVTPAARVAALSGTNSQMAKAGDSRLKLAAGARDHAQASSSVSKPKRAPLMQKTIAFMRGRFKR